MPISCGDVVVLSSQVRGSNDEVHMKVRVIILCEVKCLTWISHSHITHRTGQIARRPDNIHVPAKWRLRWCDSHYTCYELWSLCYCVTWITNKWLGHPFRLRWKSDFCCERHGQWGHASATVALQRLGRQLSLRDGFGACDEAPSWQLDASETLLHTFHLSTAWPGHEGIKMKRREERWSLGISFFFKMSFDMY